MLASRSIARVRTLDRTVALTFKRIGRIMVGAFYRGKIDWEGGLDPAMPKNGKH